jgi:acyl dehydratase
MTVPPAHLLSARVGQWIDGSTVVPDPAVTSAFAAAINDDTPGNLEGRSVTPLFGVVPIYGPLFEAVDSVTPEHLRSTIVHGAHELVVRAPIALGVPLTARARVTGIHGARAGAVVGVEIIVVTGDNIVSSQQFATAIVRGTTTVDDAGERTAIGQANPAGDGADAGLDRVVSTVLPDQNRLFAAASGDRNAVHVEDEAARQAGFSGVILHGLCTLGIVASSVTRAFGGDEWRGMRRVAARFAGPAYPGVDLVTDVRPASARAGHGFNTVDPSGRTVLSHGLIEML